MDLHIFLFCVHTKVHPFKSELEQIILFTTNTKLILLETQMVSCFHSFYCHVLAFFYFFFFIES